MTRFRKAPKAAVLIAACTAGAVALSAQVVFGSTDDTIRTGEESEWIDQLVAPVADDADPEGPLEMPRLDSTFGGPGPARALVLYDREGGRPAHQEMDGLAAANLATHFGEVTLEAVEDYAAGDMGDYDGVIYVGSSYSQQLPGHFLEDVRAGETEVLWAGANIDQLAGAEGSDEAEEFISAYGWDASSTWPNREDKVTSVVYKDVELERDERINGWLNLPEISDADAVEVLASALCGSVEEPAECRGTEGTDFPWAVRSQNLTYVTEVPFDFMEESSRYLAFADLYFDLLRPSPPVQQSRQGAVRIEDVGPESDPEDLRRVADALYERDIPFQVAVFPVYAAKVPGADPERWYAVSLKETPGVVAALQYMTERGGTIIHHGTTHQYGAWDNPYSSQSGADYEFYRAYCSATEDPPYEFEECEQDSWVRLTGSVSRDSVEDHTERLEIGRSIFRDVGLGEPEIFEVPHYAASPNAYQAIDGIYDYRYERVQYFAGLTTGASHDGEMAFTQFFPYRVHDVYGQTILPENLGNIAVEMQNNHPPRDPQFIIDNAEANLVVRDATASFFFHPFLDVEYLEEVVDGISELGYEFVPADQLR